MPEMCLKQPGFRYGKCGPFMKNKEYKKIRETSNFGYVFHNEIKLVFNMIWLVVHIKIQQQKKNSGKVLHDKSFEIAYNSNMMDVKKDLFLWFIIS